MVGEGVCGDHVVHDGVVDQFKEGHGLPLSELGWCEFGESELLLGQLLEEQIGWGRCRIYGPDDVNRRGWRDDGALLEGIKWREV